MSWRRFNRQLHRKIGFLTFAFTVVYAISGIAMNHIEHWNPHSSIQRCSH